MNPECNHLPLERLVCGELDGIALSEARRHIETCNDCAAYVAELESGNASFLQAHPFASVSRLHAPAVLLPWYRLVVQKLRQPVFLPAYSALLIVLVALPLVVTNRQQHADIMYKGRIPLTCMVQRDGQVYPKADETRLRGGDKVQIMFPLTTLCYVSLLSIDSRGTVSFYHPDRQSATCSVAAGPGPSVTFPGSMVLDNTPGAELAIVLFSPSALAKDRVHSWAKRQFDACGDVTKLQQNMRASSGVFGAGIATVLLPKEEM